MNAKKDQPVSRIDALEERREISVDSLVEEQPSFDVIVDDPPIERLPYGEMPWDRFESLCAQVLNDDRGLRITQAWLYGREGQNQHGIDILAFSEHSGRHVVIARSSYGDTVKVFAAVGGRGCTGLFQTTLPDANGSTLSPRQSRRPVGGAVKVDRLTPVRFRIPQTLALCERECLGS
ncbi:hypothetical protein PSAB6_50281 [Paraburkholderia sabiae]|uniref:hypothetical protein n=1 Tax=Paraburkholderia sabiae TaxID=273251 RepID=UPI001CB404D7|nr:hypothetical protein [Paraburkholderia sabiae]CAG9229892.1 hypothetical protein PSAB6_50281 [Paraburkholderia sabiae]